MKTAILLASWQGEKFLPAQLASLQAQTETDFEVIWQDDGSTDESVRIVEDCTRRDARFHPGKDQGQRLGAIGNFLSLLGQTDADLIFFCDQDDIWEPGKVERLAKAGREAMNALPTGTPVLVHSDASLIDEEGSLLGPSFFRRQGWDPGAVGLNRLLVQNNATGCLMMLNRPLADLVVRHGDPSKMFMHDWFVALTAAAFGKVIFVDQPLVRYRQHGKNAIGASRDSLIHRGVKALRQRENAKARIELTYSHTRAFLEAYGDELPAAAAETVQAYLATQTMSKLRRIQAIRRQGNLMQSLVTRTGQILFG